MRVRHNKNALNLLLQYDKLYIDDALKNHGKWRWYFNNNHELYIEVGCGKGQFIINQALKYPNINFIALERDSTILLKAIKKADEIIKQGYVINNLKFILGDASKIEFIFDDNEVDKIFLNFSDPWPKKRQEKRRLTYISFLKQYYLILRKEHDLELKTDNLDFFNYSIQSINDSKLFEVIYQTNDLYNELTNTYNLNNIATEYEQKFHNQGHLINKLVAKSLKKK